MFFKKLLFFITITTIYPIFSNYKSQVSQDKFLNEILFKNKKNGFFVDIGAHDGYTGSNTWFFEKDLDWNGICIEPISAVFTKLCKNRSCICINACASNKNEFIPFINVTGYAEMLSGMVENYHPLHLERLEREIKQEGGSYKIIEVPCYKINDILKRFEVTVIDYLSLDIEGGEYELLQSLDFNVYKVTAISVENNYNDSRIRDYLTSTGFTYITTLHGLDEIYVNNSMIYNLDLSILESSN